jgi:hypothetical protein
MTPAQLVVNMLVTAFALGYLACWAVHRIGNSDSN